MTSATITMTTITIPPMRTRLNVLHVPERHVAERPPGDPVEDRPRPNVAAGLPPMPGLALLRPWSRS